MINSIPATPNGLDELRSRLEQLVSEVRADAPVASTWAEFSKIGEAMTPDVWEGFCKAYPKIVATVRPVLTQFYHRYLLEWERSHGPQLMLDINTRFGQRAYERLTDLSTHVDFSSCQRFVMVGCGRVPAVLLYVADHTDVGQIVGVDRDADSIADTRKLIARYSLNRMSAVVRDGREHDYGDADVVYVANMVSPKSDVVRRIASTAPSGSVVIVREPYLLGELVTDRGVVPPCPHLRIEHEAPPLTGFRLARHVYLRRP